MQLFYQIATIGRSELGLAPDEYAGFTMTLLRMLAFEPAPTGGGGNAAGGARAAGQTGAAGAKRTGAPTVAALRAVSGSTVTAAAAPVSAGQAQGDQMVANSRRSIGSRSSSRAVARGREVQMQWTSGRFRWITCRTRQHRNHSVRKLPAQ